jgi:ubiquinone/menaquinone biosynthesis C-methylase UbiE
MTEKKERLEEEFEVAGEDEAFDDYAYITAVIAINYSLITDELSKLGDFQKGLAVDIGSGLGDLAIAVGKRYPALHITGIDIAQKAITEATKRAKAENLENLEFKIADIHRFSFADDSVDLVVSHGVLHHLKDISQALAEVYRILKPGGIAYLTDLRRDAPQEIIDEIEKSLPASQAKGFINSIRASYVPEELKEILTKMGIKNFEVSGQKFSRDTIFKNIDKLRKNTMRSADYTKLSQTVTIRK